MITALRRLSALHRAVRRRTVTGCHCLQICPSVISRFHENLLILLVLPYAADALNSAGPIGHHCTVSLQQPNII